MSHNIPPVPPLRFKTVSAARLLYLGQDRPALNLLVGDPLRPTILWMVEGAQIKRRILGGLEIVGTRSLEMSTRQTEPSAEPWGQLLVVEEDIALHEMYWEVINDYTYRGYRVVVPKGTIQDPLKRTINEDATQALRYEVPPPVGTRLTHLVYPGGIVTPRKSSVTMRRPGQPRR